MKDKSTKNSCMVAIREKKMIQTALTSVGGNGKFYRTRAFFDTGSIRT